MLTESELERQVLTWVRHGAKEAALRDSLLPKLLSGEITIHAKHPHE